MPRDDVDIAIAGGGPAGMVAGLLFARAGLRTAVFEKHADFLRDFRGDTVHPSTLRIFAELGLLDRLLALPHTRLNRIRTRVMSAELTLADLGHLPVPAPFIAMMPQWDLLDFIAGATRRYPTFTLHQSRRVAGAIEESGRIAGVRLDDGEAVRARLTIACDGRGSTLRAALGVTPTDIGAPMDVFWFRLRRPPGARSRLGIFEPGRLLVTIDRGDYFQCAYVLRKGAADAIRAEGIAAFRDRIVAVAAEFAPVVDALANFDEVKLLTVTVDRLERWHRPGLLVIGDAAHAMSPIGGVGINLAVQDAVAAANILAKPMADGTDPDPLLPRVAARRLFPTRVTQSFQRQVQDRIVAPLLEGQGKRQRPPLIARLLDRVPLLRRISGRLLGLGVRPEHVRSPERISAPPRP